MFVYNWTLHEENTILDPERDISVYHWFTLYIDVLHYAVFWVKLRTVLDIQYHTQRKAYGKPCKTRLRFLRQQDKFSTLLFLQTLYTDVSGSNIIKVQRAVLEVSPLAS